MRCSGRLRMMRTLSILLSLVHVASLGAVSVLILPGGRGCRSGMSSVSALAHLGGTRGRPVLVGWKECRRGLLTTKYTNRLDVAAAHNPFLSTGTENSNFLWVAALTKDCSGKFLCAKIGFTFSVRRYGAPAARQHGAGPLITEKSKTQKFLKEKLKLI